MGILDVTEALDQAGDGSRGIRHVVGEGRFGNSVDPGEERYVKLVEIMEEVLLTRKLGKSTTCRS